MRAGGGGTGGLRNTSVPGGRFIRLWAVEEAGGGKLARGRGAMRREMEGGGREVGLVNELQRLQSATSPRLMTVEEGFSSLYSPLLLLLLFVVSREPSGHS